MADLDHTFGGDLSVSATGDLATVDGVTQSQQRILRRLNTNPGDYLWNPTYGAGLPARIGTAPSVREIKALIQSQMALEASVSQSPPPTVTVTAINNGMAIDISYVEVESGTPVTLSFDVTA